MVARKITADEGDGWRDHRLPAHARGLAARASTRLRSRGARAARRTAFAALGRRVTPMARAGRDLRGRRSRRRSGATCRRKAVLDQPRPRRLRLPRTGRSHRCGAPWASADRPVPARLCPAGDATAAIRGRRRRRRRARAGLAPASIIVPADAQSLPRAPARRPRARRVRARRLGADAGVSRGRDGRFRHRGHGRGRWHARLQAGRGGLLGRGDGCRPLLAPARGLRLGRDRADPSSTGPTSASSTGR